MKKPQWFKEETIWLDKELVRWASGESSSPQEQVRQTYPCKMCGKVFKTCSSLSKHKDVHRGATRCLVCNTVLSRASYLKQHLASVHGITSQQQHQQKFLFPSCMGDDGNIWNPAQLPPKNSSNMIQLMDETGRPVYVCPFCGGQYKFRASLNCHMQTHKIQPVCHICHTVLNRKYDLKRHLRNVHKIDD
ncbi:hypothetical protein C0J52_01363 [Blattella germanica]|nr:hypothetical protein C0J52_01363 [Blattella germanica]